MAGPVELLKGANAVRQLASVGQDTLGEILDRDVYADDRKELEETFEGALRTYLTDTLADVEGIDAEVVDDRWDEIAAELDGLDAAFENEGAAVVRIADAIEAGLDLDPDEEADERDIRGGIEVAVAGAYRDAMDLFLDRVQDTERENTLKQEADLRIAEAVSAVDETLATIQERGRRREDAALRDEGVERLGPLYFRREDPNDPITAWRTGFDLADVAAGHALERRPPAWTDDDHDSLSGAVIDRLRDGEDLVVLGGPGSGKSTVCKRVAHRWHDAGIGEVFYLDDERETRFDGVGTLEGAIDASDREVLVVAEDAVDEAVTALYEVVDDYGDDPDVSFLFDARRSAWDDADDLLAGAGLESARASFDRVDLPAFDHDEAERAVELFGSITDGDVEIHRSIDALVAGMERADVGRPLYLAHELTGPASGEGRIPEGVSGFQFGVRRSFRAVDGMADDPRRSRLNHAVGMMVNLLNAARLPVRPAYVHALADDSDDHWAIDDALDELTGTVLVADDDRHEYRTLHERWSILYLERALSELEGWAPSLFSECVSALFGLVDDSGRRDELRGSPSGTSDWYSEIEDDPAETAGRFVVGIAGIGEERPSLADLFRNADYRVPDACPKRAQVTWHNRRGLMYLRAGDLDRADAELERMANVVGDIGEDAGTSEKRAQAIAVGNRGLIAQQRGDLDAAEEYHERSLEIDREVGDRHGEARSLNNLGLIARKRGDLDAAEHYHERSREINREVGDRHDEAKSLGNLGIVARNRGDLDAAQYYHEQSRDIKREIGDRYGEAKSLGNLGLVARKRGDLDAAEHYHERSREIKREVGDYHGEAKSLNNLGLVAQLRDNLDEAQRHHQQSLEIFREVGNRHAEARNLGSLGLIARKRGDLDKAENYHKRSWEINRDVGDRHGEATNLNNLGAVAQLRGNLDEAQHYHQRSQEIFSKVGDRHEAAGSLDNIGLVARKRGDLEEAERYHQQSLEINRDVGDRHGEAKSLGNLGRVADEQEDYSTGRDRFERANEVFLDIGAVGDALDAYRNLVGIYVEQDDLETAVDRCEEAVLYASDNDREEAVKEFRNTWDELQDRLDG